MTTTDSIDVRAVVAALRQLIKAAGELIRDHTPATDNATQEAVVQVVGLLGAHAFDPTRRIESDPRLTDPQKSILSTLVAALGTNWPTRPGAVSRAASDAIEAIHRARATRPVATNGLTGTVFRWLIDDDDMEQVDFADHDKILQLVKALCDPDTGMPHDDPLKENEVMEVVYGKGNNKTTGALRKLVGTRTGGRGANAMFAGKGIPVEVRRRKITVDGEKRVYIWLEVLPQKA